MSECDRGGGNFQVEMEMDPNVAPSSDSCSVRPVPLPALQMVLASAVGSFPGSACRPGSPATHLPDTINGTYHLGKGLKRILDGSILPQTA